MSAQWNVYESFQALLQAGPYHIALEVAFLLWTVWLLVFKRPKEKKTKLTKQEEEQLLDEWMPDNLVPNVDRCSHSAISPRLIEGKIGKYVKIKGKMLLNCGSHNYLNLSCDKSIEEASLNCLHKYGVGACGPRGFYGTTQVHLDLEQKLSEFFGCEAAILYSYGFSTFASAIPAYAKKGDIIFADECINFSLQRGLQASRSRCVYFRHNDVEHLESLLQEQEIKDKKDPKKANATRRFLVLEGTYMNTGTMCPIDEMVDLRRKYKLRVFLDDSIGFGTIGDKGRGIMSLFNIPLTEIDMLMVSLEYAAATTGGFCVGTNFIIEHQRLAGSGYTFSASMPPMLSMAAIKVLEILEKDGDEIVECVQKKCLQMHEKFSHIHNNLVLLGNEKSPVKHLSIPIRLDRRETEETILREIVSKCNAEGIAFVLATHIPGPDLPLMIPSIRIAVNKDFTDEDIQDAAKKCISAAQEVLEDYNGYFINNIVSPDSEF